MSQLEVAFAIGALFGAAARWGRFCLLRGLRQAYGLDRDEPRGSLPALQAFALALALAIVGTQVLAHQGLLDWSQAPTVRTQFSWVTAAVGGLLFGVGMVCARACGARSLVLLAGGNLRSLVTLLCMGLAAQATFTGVLAPVRQQLQGWGQVELTHATVLPWATQWLGQAPLALALTAGLPALALLAFALIPSALRRSPSQWISASAIGVLVPVAWWASAHVGVDPFEPPPLTAISFVGPIAESLLYTQLAVGRAASWGVALVLGTLAGALVWAVLSRSAQWEGFDSTARLARSIAGGLLMGLGGVLAAGCSVGQGLSGLSSLAIASMPAVLGIVAGALLALRVLKD